MRKSVASFPAWVTMWRPGTAPARLFITQPSFFTSFNSVTCDRTVQVSGVVPGVGYHVRWHGLWLEAVPGINLESLLGRLQSFKAQALQDYWTRKLDKAQARLCGIVVCSKQPLIVCDHACSIGACMRGRDERGAAEQSTTGRQSCWGEQAVTVAASPGYLPCCHAQTSGLSFCPRRRRCAS